MIQKTSRIRISFFFMAVLLISCKSIAPKAPSNSLQSIPTLTYEISSVSIPLEIELKSYLDAAEKTIPKSFSGRHEQCEGLSTSYFFTREKINFNGNGTSLAYSVNGSLKLNFNYCPKCHYLLHEKGNCIIPRVYLSCGEVEPMRRYTLDYATSIKVGTDYRFNTSTTLRNFQLLDPCKMTIANIDFTSDVEQNIKNELVELQSEIDQQFKSIDIKSSAEEAWSLLQEPTFVPGYGHLNLRPSALAINEIKLIDKKAFIGLNIDIAPCFSSEKPKAETIVLPKLGTSTKTSGLNFGLDVILSYDSLTSMVRQFFIGRSFEVKSNKIYIEDLKVVGAKGQRIIFKISISGSKKGVIYLLAQPVVNNTMKRIELRNVDFDIETKSLLLKSAKWFFSTKIIDLIEKNGNYEYFGQIEDIKKEVNSALNQEISKGVKIQGEISTIDLKHLYFATNHLVLRTQLKGDLKLILE